jgi:hypothetical protein
MTPQVIRPMFAGQAQDEDNLHCTGTWVRCHGSVSMKLTPHLSPGFDGQCEAAFRFYERCLGGATAYTLTWGDSPMAAEAPPGWNAKIAHATLKIGDTVITGSDLRR